MGGIKMKQHKREGQETIDDGGIRCPTSADVGRIESPEENPQRQPIKPHKHLMDQPHHHAPLMCRR